jgi:KDO2-lipid IV(A) lauroyltransferase
MHPLLLRTKARIREATKPLGEAAVGALTIALLRTTRYFDPIKTANLFGRIARLVGPAMREQRIGRANLTAAFPEKSPAEIETILAGVWDNLGRVPRIPETAASKSRRVPTSCLRNCGSTASPR